MKQNCSQNIIRSVRLNSERLFKLTDENHHRLERSWKRFKFLLVPEGIRSLEWTIVQWKNVPGSLIIYGNLNDWNGQYGLKCEWLCQQNDRSAVQPSTYFYPTCMDTFKIQMLTFWQATNSKVNSNFYDFSSQASYENQNSIDRTRHKPRFLKTGKQVEPINITKRTQTLQ